MTESRPIMPVAVVTGGARGIGQAIAIALSRSGFHVVIADIDESAAIEAAAGISGTGLRLDVTEGAAFRALVAYVEEQIGAIDVLVNNAGIMPIGPLLEFSDDGIDRALAINLRGVINGTRAVLPGMVARRRGHVFNVASIAGRAAVPGGSIYSASKYGVVGFTDGVREEFYPQGIKVTAVLPSFTKTELIAGTEVPKGTKASEPEDIAAAVIDALWTDAAHLYVPKSLRAQYIASVLLPLKLGRAMARFAGADRVFLDFDKSGRAAYDQRIAGN